MLGPAVVGEDGSRSIIFLCPGSEIASPPPVCESRLCSLSVSWRCQPCAESLGLSVRDNWFLISGSETSRVSFQFLFHRIRCSVYESGLCSGVLVASWVLHLSQKVCATCWPSKHVHVLVQKSCSSLGKLHRRETIFWSEPGNFTRDTICV